MQQTHVCFVFLLIRVSKSSDYHYRSIPRINAILFLRKELREREKKVLKEVLSSSDIVLGKCFFLSLMEKSGILATGCRRQRANDVRRKAANNVAYMRKPTNTKDRMENCINIFSLVLKAIFKHEFIIILWCHMLLLTIYASLVLIHNFHLYCNLLNSVPS